MPKVRNTIIYNELARLTLNEEETRMTTSIGKKFSDISDDQTNIDKYRLAANITEYHIISKLILKRIIITHFCGPVSHLR